MLTALTRAVSRSLGDCELTWHARQKIDVALASLQHDRYEDVLRSLGVNVISLVEEPDLPDAVFVEDPLVVVDEIAIVTRMGALSRRAESDSLELAISKYRPVRHLRGPATLEGGDVMRIGRDIFVGLSSRTNCDGIEQLRAQLEPLGYFVRPIEVRGCLHLKSACSSIGDGRILANPKLLDASGLSGYEVVEVPTSEPSGANVLRIGDAVIVAYSFPGTAAVLQNFGLRVVSIDISELMKAEAAITCSSVLFET
jgi:dimethylargininase